MYKIACIFVIIQLSIFDAHSATFDEIRKSLEAVDINRLTPVDFIEIAGDKGEGQVSEHDYLCLCNSSDLFIKPVKTLLTLAAIKALK